MVLRKYYIGSTGPYFYDDALPLNDPEGDFAGLNQTAFMTDGELAADNVAASETTVSINIDTTLTDDDRINFLLVTTGVPNITVTLPTVLDNEGRVISIKKIDAGTGSVIIEGEGAETIDGALTRTLLAQYEVLTIRSENGQWIVVSEASGLGAGWIPIEVLDIDNPDVTLNAMGGIEGQTLFVYEVVPAQQSDLWTIYAYDESGPPIASPFVVDALDPPVGATGFERWIAIEGRYSVTRRDPVAVADITNPTEVNSVSGVIGDYLLAYQVAGGAGLDLYTIYAYDASGPAVNAPYVMDAGGGGAERWIAIAGASVGIPQVAIDLTAEELKILDTNQSDTLELKWNEDDAAARILNLLVNAADRTVNLSGNIVLGGTLDVDDQLTINLGGAARIINLLGTLDIDNAFTVNCNAAARALNMLADLTVNAATSLNQSLLTTSTPTFVLMFLTAPKSGATQAAAGAAANEVWKTNGHASLPDNVLMIGV